MNLKLDILVMDTSVSNSMDSWSIKTSRYYLHAAVKKKAKCLKLTTEDRRKS